MRLILILPIAALSACTTPSFQGIFGPGPLAPAVAPAPTLNPTPPPPPPANAVTHEQFDTTTQEERDAAVATDAAASDRALGTTIATLGPPAQPGIWLETPLVTALTPGRIDYQGKSINIELRPSGGAAGSGSQISLAAMRLIEAPLTGLPELTVFVLAP
jgi:hypothetical protein